MLVPPKMVSRVQSLGQKNLNPVYDTILGLCQLLSDAVKQNPFQHVNRGFLAAALIRSRFDKYPRTSTS